MNEIEKAIEHFHYGITHDIFSEPVTTYARLAVDALREQAERSKGCEYCLQGEDLAYGLDSMQRTGRIYIDGNLLTADLYSESMAVAVCCCPVCGRRLEVEP